MMNFFLFFVCFYIWGFTMSSLHSLVLLILIEYVVLLAFFYMVLSQMLVSSLFFLLVGVCMGAFSLCIYISDIRSKGSYYVMSFG